MHPNTCSANKHAHFRVHFGSYINSSSTSLCFKSIYSLWCANLQTLTNSSTMLSSQQSIKFLCQLALFGWVLVLFLSIYSITSILTQTNQFIFLDLCSQLFSQANCLSTSIADTSIVVFSWTLTLPTFNNKSNSVMDQSNALLSNQKTSATLPWSETRCEAWISWTQWCCLTRPLNSRMETLVSTVSTHWPQNKAVYAQPHSMRTQWELQWKRSCCEWTKHQLHFFC